MPPSSSFHPQPDRSFSLYCVTAPQEKTPRQYSPEGGRFESGKAVGFREALVILEYMTQTEVEEFTENSESGAVAELLESLRP